MENKKVKKIVLEHRLNLINEMIELNEFDFLDRARKWLKNKYYGAEQRAKDWYRQNVLIDPKSTIENPEKVSKILDVAISKAKKRVIDFKADAIRSSEAINKLQDSIFELLGKFYNLLDEIPQTSRGRYEREIMKVVSMFYIALMEEKRRIEVYLSALAREAGSKGYNLGASATAMAAYKPEKAPRIVGSRIVEPEEEEEIPLSVGEFALTGTRR